MLARRIFPSGHSMQAIRRALAYEHSQALTASRPVLTPAALQRKRARSSGVGIRQDSDLPNQRYRLRAMKP